MESRLTIGCAGALLTYIGRRKAVEYLPSDADASSLFRIATVEMFNLQGTMYVPHAMSGALLQKLNTPGSLMLTR